VDLKLGFELGRKVEFRVGSVKSIHVGSEHLQEAWDVCTGVII